MTDFEFFSSAVYQFLHSPEVATLRAHYERHGVLFGDAVFASHHVKFIDRDGSFMFEVTGENAIERAQKMYNAALA